MTSMPFSTCSHFTMTDVSRPPEYARTTFSLVLSDMMLLPILRSHPPPADIETYWLVGGAPLVAAGAGNKKHPASRVPFSSKTRHEPSSWEPKLHARASQRDSSIMASEGACGPLDGHGFLPLSRALRAVASVEYCRQPMDAHGHERDPLAIWKQTAMTGPGKDASPAPCASGGS